MGNPIPRQKNIMSQSTYQSVVLASRPKSLIVPGETFNLKSNPMISEKDLKDDQVLVEALYLSLDPAMRGWLNGLSSFLPFPYHTPPHVTPLTQANRYKIIHATGPDRCGDARHGDWQSGSLDIE